MLARPSRSSFLLLFYQAAAGHRNLLLAEPLGTCHHCPGWGWLGHHPVMLIPAWAAQTQSSGEACAQDVPPHRADQHL